MDGTSNATVMCVEHRHGAARVELMQCGNEQRDGPDTRQIDTIAVSVCGIIALVRAEGDWECARQGSGCN